MYLMSTYIIITFYLTLNVVDFCIHVTTSLWNTFVSLFFHYLNYVSSGLVPLGKAGTILCREEGRMGEERKLKTDKSPKKLLPFIVHGVHCHFLKVIISFMFITDLKSDYTSYMAKNNSFNLLHWWGCYKIKCLAKQVDIIAFCRLQKDNVFVE